MPKTGAPPHDASRIGNGSEMTKLAPHWIVLPIEIACPRSERFRRACREAGGAVGSMGDQLSSWLRRDPADDDERV